MAAVEYEIERLTEVGQKLGFAGKELLEFVANEREALRQQRMEERQARAEERAYEKELLQKKNGR